mgnify:CR=1 FL=1
MSKLTNCKVCGKEVAKGAKCPNCGKDQRNFFERHKILTVILVIFILGIMGNMGSQDVAPRSADNISTVENTTVAESVTEELKADPKKVVEPEKIEPTVIIPIEEEPIIIEPTPQPVIPVDKPNIFEGYKLIEVDGGNLSGHRESNVVVDV